MYAIHFRIPVGNIAGQGIFVNGCAASPTPREKGDFILVTHKGSVPSSPNSAEVYGVCQTGRDLVNRPYQWEIAFFS